MPTQVSDKCRREYIGSVSKGEIASAYRIALQAAHLNEVNEDFRLAGIWRRGVASCLYYQGRLSEASIEAERSAEMQPEPYERARSLILVAGIHAWSLNPNAAFMALGKAEEIARSFPHDTSLNATVHACRAEIFSTMRDLDQAIVNAERCAQLNSQGGFSLAAAKALNNLGFLLAKQQQFKVSEQRLQSGLELVGKEPHPFLEAATCDSLGYVYTRIRRHRDAELLFQRSIKIFEGVPNNAELAASLLHLSELHQQMRLYHIARDEATRALKLATETKLQGLGAEARNLLSSLESDLHRYPENGSMKVQRLRYLIGNNLQRNLSLEEMARAVYLSPFRLAHLFKIQTGTSPASYVKAARMEKAKDLLETSSLSVKGIMFEVGLRDESHFVRDFKKRYGMTPTQHRRQFLAEKNLANKAASAR